MDKKKFLRPMVMNFISALILSYLICSILTSFKLHDVIYIGNLFGLYFFVVYGINNLVDAGEIPNDYRRFVLVILSIILFDIVFVIIMPWLTGADLFANADWLVLIFDGIKLNLTLDTNFYLALFGVVMLIFNFILYRRQK